MNITSLYLPEYFKMIRQPGTSIYFIDLFVTQYILIPGTLVNRIVDTGISRASLIFSGCTNSGQSSYTAEGLVAMV